MNKVKKKWANTTILLGICMILVKITSFARDIILSYAYGAGSVSDAYLVSVSIPTVLFTGILTAIYTSYVPIYHEIRVKDINAVNNYTSNIINFVGILSVFLLIIFLLLRNEIVYIFAVGFYNETFALTVELSCISIFSVIFMAVVYVLQGYLQANSCFFWVAFFMVPVNLIMAVGIIASYLLGKTFFLGASIVIGYAVIVPIFWKVSKRKGFRYSLCLNINDEYLKKTLMVVAPIFVGQMLAEINNIVDKNMASRLSSGTVTCLDYGFKVSAMIYGIFAWPVATQIFPKVSSLLSEGKEAETNKTVRRGMEIVGAIIIPVTVIVVVLAQPIVEFLFYRGAFEAEDVKITSEVLAIYAISAIPIGYRTVLEKVYFAMRETKKTVLFSTVGIVINIVLDIVLLGSLKHIGLALATTCSCFVATICYVVWISRKREGIINKSFILTTIQTVISTFVMLCLLLVVKRWLYRGLGEQSGVLFIKLILMGGISIVSYIVSWMVAEKVKKHL